MTRKINLMAAVAVAAVMGMSFSAMAASLNLSSGTEVNANIGYGYTNTTSGQSSVNPRSGLYWSTRENTNVVDKIADTVQWTYLYRVGAGSNTEINTGATSIVATPGARPNSGKITYTYSGFTIGVQYSLSSGGPGSFSSTLTRNITITNTSASAMNMTFTSIADQTLTGYRNHPAIGNPAYPAGELDGNGVLKPGARYDDNTDSGQGTEFAKFKTVGTTRVAEQWDTHPGSSGSQISNSQTYFQSSALGNPTRVEAGQGGGSDVTGTLLNKLVGTSYNLNNNNQSGGSLLDDVAFAAQWDIALNAGESVQITENTVTVPEPASLALLGLGAGLMLVRRRQA